MANSGVRALCVAVAPVQLAVFSICGIEAVAYADASQPFWEAQKGMKAKALLWSIPIIPRTGKQEDWCIC